MEFKHTQSAHCETGVTGGLLRYQGLDLAEPLIFGMGSGIFFIHLPLIKLNGVAATSYRIWPGGIFDRVTKLMGARVVTRKFKSPEKAMAALDELLSRNIPVGIMCSVYYLPYMPDSYRFHFNAHNLLIIGKEGEEYIVSDPVLQELKRLHKDDLQKARFAKGFPEPSGKLYYIESLDPQGVDLKEGIKKGIRRTGFLYSNSVLPFIGAQGIKFLARKIRKYPEKLGDRKSMLSLGNLIRMQEEIGTGGGGFRFMYSAFLKQAGGILANEELNILGDEMTKIGDMWRNFAFEVARFIKNRDPKPDAFNEIASLLEKIGDREIAFFKRLRKVKF